jgi:Flp pilus assembly protein TadD
MDWAGAEAEARRALQLVPNDATPQGMLAQLLAARGQNARAVELVRQALASDPRSTYRWRSLSVYLTALGRLDEARQAIDKAIALQPGATVNHEQLAVIAILRGDAEAALVAAQKEPPGPWHDVAMALALQIGPDRKAADAALKKLTAKYAQSAPYQIAEAYALRRDPDAMFQWLDRAWTARDPGVISLLNDPLILRYRDDPRFAAFCKKVGLPTATDAVAMK